MKKILSLVFIIGCVISAFSQQSTGTLEGKLIDDSTGEGLIGASITVYKYGEATALKGASTDIDGNYSITNIQAGKYDVEFVYVGYNSKKQVGVVLFAGQVTRLNIRLLEGVTMQEVVIEAYTVPIISHDRTTTGKVITSEEIKSLPKRNINSRRSRLAGVSRRDRAKKPKPPTTESYARINENRFKNTQATPLSTFSIDVDRASYSNIRRFINEGGLPPQDAVRIEEMINYFHYKMPEPSENHPIGIQTEYSDCPWNDKHQLLRVSLASKTIAKEALPPSNLVFLLDVSGSMNSSNKLPLLKQAIEILVGQLRQDDKVSIVVYAGAAGLVLPPTNGNDKNKILEAVNALSAGGSTAGGAGINLAYKIAQEQFIKDGNNRIILATDGDFNVGASSDRAMEDLIEEKRETGIYLTCLGLGMGNYKDSKIELLADKGNGNYAYIDNLNEAKKIFDKEFSATMYTVAKDVKLQLEFNPNHVAAYRLIGYENRALNDEDFDNDAIDAGEIGAGHQVTALYEIIPTNVKSTFLPKSKALKYQRKKSKKKFSEELLTVKFRYKAPNSKKSQLLETVVKNEKTEANQDLSFAASVAMFGMILRQSEFMNGITFDEVLRLAEANLGEDKNGYRKEFIVLVKSTKEMKDITNIEEVNK